MVSLTNYKEELESVKTLIGNKVNATTFNQSNLFRVLVTIQNREELKTIIDKLRIIQDKNEKQKYKLNNLPFFTIGEFIDNKRTNNSFISTQYMIFDIDGIADEYNDVYKKLKSDKYTFIIFKSPSGNGIKVIVRLNTKITDPNHYTSIYKIFSQRYQDEYGIKTDNTSDPSRACFFSYDPDMYINPTPDFLDTNIDLSVNENQHKSISREVLFDKLENGVIGTGQRTHTLTELVGIFINKGIDVDLATYLAEGWNLKNTTPLPEDKVNFTVTDMYKRYANQSMSEKCKDFYSLNDSYYKASIVGGKFKMAKIGKEKLLLMQNIRDKSKSDELISYMVKDKHIDQFQLVTYLADANIEKPYYEYDANNGTFEVHIPPIEVRVKDNLLIEEYLEKTFGEYKDFIKKWLAIYCYVNFRKLPNLIFTGERGTGKSTFAESIAGIFPSLSVVTKELEGHFNPAAEKKLIIMDESDAKGKIQYTTLKKYSGQKKVEVNKKYEMEYEVKNNMNFIILSNSPRAIYVKREELPTDEKNNQFFVFNYKKLNDSFDPDFTEKLIDRWGHYVRTELKKIFQSIDFQGYRYSIPVPITDAERELFQNSITEIEADTDMVIQQLITDMESSSFEWKSHIQAGEFPTDYLKSLKLKNQHKIIDELKCQKYLKETNSVRLTQIGGNRPYGYYLDDKWIKEIHESQKVSKAQSVDPDQEQLL